MMQHHHYSLTELEMMMPWEREIYVTLLMEYIKEENERRKNQGKYLRDMPIDRETQNTFT